MWPAVDPKRRAAALAELRRRQAHDEAHELTAVERLARAEAVRASFEAPRVPGRATSSDEPGDLWMRILVHLRTCA